ncbi:MAG: RNA polymerase sigma factor [Pseudomonadota bacterium]
MERLDALEFTAQSTRLAERASLGDRKAFGQLLRLWHPRLKAFALRKAGTDGEDVLQMAALTLAQDIGKLRDPSRFGPWAMTMIARRAADHFGEQYRETRRRDALAAEPNPTQSDPETDIAQRDRLQKALSALPPAPRTLLTLHHIDGLTGPEIARLLSLPISTVKSRLHTARTHLRAAYTSQKET